MHHGKWLRRKRNRGCSLGPGGSQNAPQTQILVTTTRDASSQTLAETLHALSKVSDAVLCCLINLQGSAVEVACGSLTTKSEPWAVGVGLDGGSAMTDRVDLFGDASYVARHHNAGETNALSTNAGPEVTFQKASGWQNSAPWKETRGTTDSVQRTGTVVLARSRSYCPPTPSDSTDQASILEELFDRARRFVLSVQSTAPEP